MLLLITQDSLYTQTGYAFFSYECISQGIRFYPYGASAIEFPLDQLAQPLSTAVSSHQNQFITSSGDVELWALESNELQIHFLSDIEGTKLILPADVCGALEWLTPALAVQAWAYTQAESGSALADAGLLDDGTLFAQAQVNGIGFAIALVEVFPWGKLIAFAQANGGFAYAIVQMTPLGELFLSTQAIGSAEAGSIAWTQTGGNTHIVSSGETLFSIAMRYNTSVEMLTLLNGLENPELIHAGLVLQVP